MNVMTGYDAKYNGLLSVEAASSMIKNCSDFSNLLRRIGREIVALGFHEKIGVRLLHKHNSISFGDIMIEREEIIEGSPALSTVRLRSEDLSSEFVPNVWACDTNGDMTPYEFTERACVDIDNDFFVSAKSLFQRVGQLLQGHPLKEVLALTFVSKPRFLFDSKACAAVEYSDPSRDANIIVARRRNSLNHNRLIETTWDFASSSLTMCTPSCYAYCVQYSPGHAIEHNSQHIFDDDSP